MATIRFDEPRYEAGACNIGPAEIARRRQSGFAGLIGAAILAGLLVVIEASAMLRLGVGVPLFLGFLGLLQAHLRFCVAFGLGGFHNLGAIGEGRRVQGRRDRIRDARRAALLVLVAAVVAGAIAVGFALLP